MKNAKLSRFDLGEDVRQRRARAAARKLARDGMRVRYVRTTFLPRDETCFHVFEADSDSAVAEACRLANFDTPRIVPAVE